MIELLVGDDRETIFFRIEELDVESGFAKCKGEKGFDQIFDEYFVFSHFPKVGYLTKSVELFKTFIDG